MSLALQSQTWFPTHVQVTVLQAKALRTKGKAGTNDAYCIIQLGKEKYSTSVAEKSVAPLWKEEATFELPLLHQGNQERCTLYVIVMHRALVGLDKFLGQAALNLWELHQEKNRRKIQWYRLQSKPGKKAKERGQIEVDIQFMRNNMTASMFDLSMKEKSQSPFRKLKDKIKRKQHDGLPDTSSAIVPSITRSAADSDEENAPKKEKKNKIKTLFSKPGLQKNSLSQSMSVLPTFQQVPAASEKTVLKPSDFRPSSDNEPLSTKSENPFQSKTEGRSSKLAHLPVIMSHKRTISADHSQINQMTSGNTKKEGLSFFSGLRSKNDPITRSNVCINGNHVYVETEPKSDTLPKDNSIISSPLVLRKHPVYASAENLSSKSLEEAVTTAGMPADKNLPKSASKESLKSRTMPVSKISASEESGGIGTLANFNPPKEMQGNKKTALEESQDRNASASFDPPKEIKESKKPSLLTFVTGKKDVAQINEPFSEISLEDREKPVINPKKESETAPTIDALSKKKPFNPFDEDLTVEEKKPEPPLASARTTKTTAVKPRVDVSSEDETKARLASTSSSDFSFSLPTNLSNDRDEPFSVSSKLGKETKTQDLKNLSTLHSTFTPVDTSLSWSSHGKIVPSSKEDLTNLELFEPQNETLTNKRNITTRTSNLNSERPKEKQIVPPFTEKNINDKSSVKSLLDELKAKKENASPVQSLNAVLQDGSLASKHREKFHEKQTESLLGKREEFAHVANSSSPKTKVTSSTFPETKTNNEDKETFNQTKVDDSLKERECIHQLDSTLLLLNKNAISSPTDNHPKKNDSMFSIPNKEQGARTQLDDVIDPGVDVKSKSEEQPTNNILFHQEPPKPAPRVQMWSTKEGKEEGPIIETESKPIPPKPMPRKLNKIDSDSLTNNGNLMSDSLLTISTVSMPKLVVHKETLKPERDPGKNSVQLDAFTLEKYKVDDGSQSKADFSEDLPCFITDDFKMATSALDDELPIIPERPEVSDDDSLADINQVEKVIGKCKDSREPVKHYSNIPCSIEEKLESSSHIPSEETCHPKSSIDLTEKQSDHFKSSKSNQNVAFDKQVSYPNSSSQQEPKHQFMGVNDTTESRKSDRSDLHKNNSPNEPDTFLTDHSLSSPSALSSSSSLQLPSDTYHKHRAESPKGPTAEGSDKAENAGKKKLLRAWVSPSETHPIPIRQNDGTASAKHRLHPVKPMNTTQTRTSTTLNSGTMGKNQENIIKLNAKNYDPSDPASAYAQLTHDELIQLVLKQKETISNKELQVRELERYIDNLLVRVMEATPSILRVSTRLSKKAGKI